VSTQPRPRRGAAGPRTRCARTRVRVTRALIPWLLASALAACAAIVDARPEYDRAVEEIRAVTGATDVYHPAADDDVAARVRVLLRDGLSQDEAVEVGLLTNPRLQAAFRRIGIAKAERVQAGLLGNPSLGAALRRPSAGGSVAIEAALLGSLADLWQIDTREAVAQDALARRILEVAHEAASLAADLRAAYLDALAAARMLEVAEESHALASELVALVEARAQVRAATGIDVNLAQIERLDADVDRRDARLRDTQARRRLVALLGWSREPEDLVLTGTLVDGALPIGDTALLGRLALERRLEVRAARAALDEAVAGVRREQDLTVRVVDLGIAAEREDGWSVGPGVDIELPVFDANETGVARALDEIARRERLLAAARLEVAHDVASARDRVQASREAAVLYTDGILPHAEATRALAREGYEAGETTLVAVIQAQREVLEARRALARRLEEAALALADLERATGTTREVLEGLAERVPANDEAVPAAEDGR